MNTPLTKVKASLNAVLSEYADCHLVIAFEPMTGSPMVLVNAPDPKSALAINAVLLQIAEQGGIGVTQQVNEDGHNA